MFCPKCGAEINDRAVLCVHCGTQLSVCKAPAFAGFDKSCGLASHYETTEEVALTVGEVDQRMCNLSAYGVYFTLCGRNVTSDGFEYFLSVNLGLWSYGENIYVRCCKSDSGSWVNIFSKCIAPIQIFDWGKNRRNAKSILRVLEA